MLRSGSFAASFSALLITCALSAPCVQAGLGGLGQQRAVGGVMIAPDGRVRAATAKEQKEMASIIAGAVGQPAGELAEATDRRVVSLKKLQQAINEAQQTGGRTNPEVEFLAGLQRVQYVIVDESNQDILLAGPAEPWTLKADGSVVGRVSGQSVMRLEDLMSAFRSVETAREVGGIRCSIEPTADGRQRLQQYLSRVRLGPGQNPKFLEAGMREAFGPQQILIDGVAKDSRLARTLVAADFEMKRIAMGLVDSPVPGLPSYLEMARNTRQTAGQNPRWWMACDYEPIARNDTGDVWKLSGPGVKTMTEQDITQADGSTVGAGRTDQLAQDWADKMTERYEMLSKSKPIFRDLRNVMDMVVVATLIRQQDLDQVSGLDLAVLRGETGGVESIEFNMPKSLEPQCSFVRGNVGWTVTASGGVDVNAFLVVQDQVRDPSLGTLVADRRRESARWWWNAD
ncbi:MAG: DUF1598 domain-containing protein [Planctomycetota bacterium]